MCGIAGACWTNREGRLERQSLEAMIAVQRNRGPDDSGLYQAEFDSVQGAGVALGHARLSIIDLDSGHQPLANEDETVWIVFNGEIYNYRELRTRLESAGHKFRTSSDTEVIVHLYEEYGTKCVDHLQGMFAFAIWDGNRKRLFLARDRLGQKPLIYRCEKNRLVFASELKALLQIPGARRELNPEAVDAYLTYQYVPHPLTILKGYAKLPPGHRAVFENGQLKIDKYWTPPFEPGAATESNPAATFSSVQDWQQELRKRLTSAVELRLRSDVPLGAFLSGGIDSTIISGLMQQLSDQKIHTFSIGFPVAKFDERVYAREASHFLGTEHHEEVVEPSALSMLPKLIWSYDEPFADSSAIPTMYLSEMTRQYVKVVLSGDGGDELFAGYDRYQAIKIGSWFDRFPRGVRKLAASSIWQKLPASVEQKSKRRRLKRLLAAMGEEPRRRYLKWITIFDEARREGLYSTEFKLELGNYDAADFLLAAFETCPSRDMVTRTSCADVLTYLPCDILTKVDRASMAYGLECRSPLLDHPVVELAAAMPIELKMSRGKKKKILTDTFSDLIPHSIQNRPKMGFGVPIDHWFRNELKELLYDTLLDDRALGRGLFNPDAVRKLVEEHVSAKWDHSYRLWSLLCLELWQRMFLDSPTAPAECDLSI